MVILYTKIHKEVIRKLNKLGKSQDYLAKKYGFSRSTIYRLSHGKEIKLATTLKLLDFLDDDVNKYIKYEANPIEHMRKMYRNRVYC